MQVHYFNADGFFTHSGELPINPVSGKPFDPNPDVCVPGPLPQYDPETERARRVAGAWSVEPIPLPEPEPEQPDPEPVPPTVCTPAQGLVALYALRGITEQDLLSAIGGIADPVARYTAQVGLQRATAWSRESPTMQAVASLFGLSEPDIDALFEYAVTVSV